MFKLVNSASPATRLKLSVDYRLVSVALLAVLVLCVFLWKPWNKTETARNITVTGSATVRAAPDQYQLSPYFEFTTGAHVTLVSSAVAMSTQVSAKLKELGVKDTEISSSTNSYDKYLPATDGSTTDSVRLNYTITLTSKDTAQKVQDYLLTTSAKGQITPYASFSEVKQKQLEADARDQAIKNAKDKALKSAEQVSSRLGKVIKISDDSVSNIRPIMAEASGASLDTAKQSIPIRTGLNEFSVNLQIEYELR